MKVNPTRLDAVIRQAQQEVVQIHAALARVEISTDAGSPKTIADVAAVAQLTTDCVVSLTAALYLLSERFEQHLNSGDLDHPELMHHAGVSPR